MAIFLNISENQRKYTKNQECEETQAKIQSMTGSPSGRVHKSAYNKKKLTEMLKVESSLITLPNFTIERRKKCIPH